MASDVNRWLCDHAIKQDRHGRRGKSQSWAEFTAGKEKKKGNHTSALFCRALGITGDFTAYFISHQQSPKLFAVLSRAGGVDAAAGGGPSLEIFQDRWDRP